MRYFSLTLVFVFSLGVLIQTAEMNEAWAQNSANSSKKTTLFNRNGGDSSRRSGPLFFKKKLTEPSRNTTFQANPNRGTVYRPAPRPNYQRASAVSDIESMLQDVQQSNLTRSRANASKNLTLAQQHRASSDDYFAQMRAQYEASLPDEDTEKANVAPAAPLTNLPTLPGASGAQQPISNAPRQIYIKKDEKIEKPKRVWNIFD